MEKGFVFQIRKIVDKGACGIKKVLIGDPVIVDGDCQEEAQCEAAVEKLKERHHVNGGYHAWLVKQSEGECVKPNVYMPYEWFVVQGEIAY